MLFFLLNKEFMNGNICIFQFSFIYLTLCVLYVVNMMENEFRTNLFHSTLVKKSKLILNRTSFFSFVIFYLNLDSLNRSVYFAGVANEPNSAIHLFNVSLS